MIVNKAFKSKRIVLTYNKREYSFVSNNKKKELKMCCISVKNITEIIKRKNKDVLNRHFNYSI